MEKIIVAPVPYSHGSIYYRLRTVPRANVIVLDFTPIVKYEYEYEYEYGYVPDGSHNLRSLATLVLVVSSILLVDIACELRKSYTTLFPIDTHHNTTNVTLRNQMQLGRIRMKEKKYLSH